jgi:hypothetical protein
LKVSMRAAPLVAESTRVFRVQDGSGRGPWRPGFSMMWVDASDVGEMTPTWEQEFGPDAVTRLGRPGEHFGCACLTIEGLARWFRPVERERLAAFGFRVVQLNGARILAASENQVLFARSIPFVLGAVVRRWP